MKVLFLDVDGVLNSQRWPSSFMPERAIDPQAMQLLNDLVGRTGAEVVVSSTWRLLEPDMAGRLARNGFVGQVIGQTPEIRGAPRGREIVTWLSQHPDVERFAILDVNADMESLHYRLVQTSFETGLEQAHVELAVSLLSRPLRAQRRRARNYRLPPNVVTVTRPTRWGNPYVGDDPKLCLDAYRVHASGLDLSPLRGKDLACWCAPGAPCHADILLELANKEVSK